MEPTAAPSSAPPPVSNAVKTDVQETSETTSSDVKIDAMGDVSCVNGIVLKSLLHTTGERVAQSLRFIVEFHPKKGTLILCYVDPRGKLHHYYNYHNGMLDHDESTYTGDAFVAYYCTQETDSIDKPLKISDLLNKEKYTVLCSYRLKLALNDTYIHCVHYVSNGEAAPIVTVTAMPKQDNEYRVVVGLPRNLCRLPPPHESWQVSYDYVCPPLPTSNTWNSNTHTMYVWGDLDFDDYGASHISNVPVHLRTVHSCYMNQIVPQTMIGNCLAENDDTYKPKWKTFDQWVIQAQYYWQPTKDNGRALCGKYMQVEPGDLIRTRICYTAENGSIQVSISVVGEDGEENSNKRSEIVIPKPFLHDVTLFESWKDFFSKCLQAERLGEDENRSKVPRCEGKESTPALRGSKDSGASMGAKARPCLNVEYKGRVDMDTLKSICPFVVKKATYPGLPPDFTTTKWKTYLYCPRTGNVNVLEDSAKRQSLAIEDAVTLG